MLRHTCSEGHGMPREKCSSCGKLAWRIHVHVYMYSAVAHNKIRYLRSMIIITPGKRETFTGTIKQEMLYNSRICVFGSTVKGTAFYKSGKLSIFIKIWCWFLQNISWTFFFVIEKLILNALSAFICNSKQ